MIRRTLAVSGSTNDYEQIAQKINRYVKEDWSVQHVAISQHSIQDRNVLLYATVYVIVFTKEEEEVPEKQWGDL